MCGAGKCSARISATTSASIQKTSAKAFTLSVSGCGIKVGLLRKWLWSKDLIFIDHLLFTDEVNIYSIIAEGIKMVNKKIVCQR